MLIDIDIYILYHQYPYRLYVHTSSFALMYFSYINDAAVRAEDLYATTVYFAYMNDAAARNPNVYASVANFVNATSDVIYIFNIDNTL